MAGREHATGRYAHSAYWYASHYGWTHSEAESYSGAYLDFHTYTPGGTSASRGRAGKGAAKGLGRNAGLSFDSNFNPLVFGVCIAMDIGVAIRRDVRNILDPVERDRIKRELMRDLRSLRRPFYYARETERRRQLAAERRKVKRRRTTAPMPTPEDLRAAWAHRKDSGEAMVRLGGLLHDLDCYVDNCLRFDADGRVVGRNGGIRGWLRACVPELEPKYKTLMRYKAMAVRLRQVTGTEDPVPTAALLDAPERSDVVEEMISTGKPVFSRAFAALEWRLDPETVFLEKSKKEKPRISGGTKNENSLRNFLGRFGRGPKADGRGRNKAPKKKRT